MKTSFVHAAALTVALFLPVIFVSAFFVPILELAAFAETPPQTPARGAPVIRDCAAISSADHNLAPLSAACEFVKVMDRTLPNVICEQTTQRYFPITPGGRQSEERHPDDLIADTIKATVTYESGVDRYADIKVGDIPVQPGVFDVNAPMAKGDFGSELLSIFLKENAAVFVFREQTQGPEEKEYVFDFWIPAATNHAFTLREDSLETHPDVEGTVWVSAETKKVRRLDMLANKINSAFATDHARFSTVFGNVQFGNAGEFRLPTQSESTLCTRRHLCTHLVTGWANCKAFAAKSRIISVSQ